MFNNWYIIPDKNASPAPVVSTILPEKDISVLPFKSNKYQKISFPPFVITTSRLFLNLLDISFGSEVLKKSKASSFETFKNCDLEITVLIKLKILFLYFRFEFK